MFAHLHVHSPFSFLDGASSLDSLLAQAAEIGCQALAITDHNNVSGAVRFHKLAEKYGIRPIQGCEITLTNGHCLTLLSQNRTGYANLCRLLTFAHMNSQRGLPAIPRSQLGEYSEGLLALSGCRKGEVPSLILQEKPAEALQVAMDYAQMFPGRFYIEMQENMLPRTGFLNRRLNDLATHLHLPLVATANSHYATKDDFPLHDLLTCVRTLTTLDSIHPSRRLNAENYLHTYETMVERFQHKYPAALHGMAEIAESCEVALPLHENLFPSFTPPGGNSAKQFLRQLTLQGARRRYGKLTAKIQERLDHELKIINTLGVADYFLVAWDVARFAREKGIRYAGRGSAADSAVAYCLYITDVDSVGRNLLFERFLSLERAQKPDIDIDFDAHCRDDVARYVYETYGEDHVASVCTYYTYHARSALRDLGKAMGFAEEEIGKLAKLMPHMPADGIRRAITHLPELRKSGIPFSRYEKLIAMSERLADFPRHIGTHLGGLVISSRPINEVSPLQKAAKGVAIIQFDKNDIEELGLIKLDLLSLRTLSAVDTAVQDIHTRQKTSRQPLLDYRNIPKDDASTYSMINRGETIGVFQLESPAQRALQSRLLADNIEDIVASIALIRPGPIKGEMVEPFIQRRHGREPVSYIHPSLERILSKTYGVVLYQEQVIEIATSVAGFTPGESDRLRKVMTSYRSQKEMESIGEVFITKAVQNGVKKDIAEKVFSYIVGYAGYGFCEAHAAAFSDTAYKTAYLINHYPAEFFAAILSNQPMGFYPPRTVCLEAKRRGVRILPPDVNKSTERFAVENGAIRVSLMQVRGMNAKVAAEIVKQRQEQPFRSLLDFCRRVTAPRNIFAHLILAGGFDPLHPNRRQVFWQLNQTLEICSRDYRLPLPLEMTTEQTAPALQIADYTPLQKHRHEVSMLGFSPKAHLLHFYREQLARKGVKTSRTVAQMPQGKVVKVAGMVVQPHRPPTKSGRTVVFLSLEDEFGLCDVTIFENVYKRFAQAIFGSPALVVQGRVERRGRGVSVTANHIAPLSME